jgi:molybdopterin/thiamine biosynthesis adenylyltransferase
MDNIFNYGEAFARNIGWVTREEQQILRKKRIAIAGLGGVGGVHLITLARLGIGAFNISDLDIFELANFNRQAGAMTSTIGASKAETMARMAKDINPELDIRIYPDGITRENVDSFLKDVDLYIDGMDFFAFDARESLFSACHRMKIPAITAGPLGMSVALLNFLPGKMSFEEYFCWEGQPEEEKAVRFLLGLSPARLHFPYLVDPTSVNFSERRGPSTSIACQLCAGLASAEALKILLGRGVVLAAPWGMQFDAYLNKFKRTWRPGGNRNLLQVVALAIARRRLDQLNRK